MTEGGGRARMTEGEKAGMTEGEKRHEMTWLRRSLPRIESGVGAFPEGEGFFVRDLCRGASNSSTDGNRVPQVLIVIIVVIVFFCGFDRGLPLLLFHGVVNQQPKEHRNHGTFFQCSAGWDGDSAFFHHFFQPSFLVRGYVDRNFN